MSSSATRRFKRRMARDKKKGIFVPQTNMWGEPELELPTEKDVEDYILDKTRELRMMNITPNKINNNVQLQGE